MELFSLEEKAARVAEWPFRFSCQLSAISQEKTETLKWNRILATRETDQSAKGGGSVEALKAESEG